jgi:hypothetical protein
MRHLILFAGLAFDPGFKGILVVATAVAILGGSVYLILATNMGARLGLLVALAGLFGWLTILTLTWWIQPPGNGPRGTNPSWKPVEIFVEGGGNPDTEVLATLPSADDLPSPADIVEAHPEMESDFPDPSRVTLTDIAGAFPDVLAEYVETDNLNGWRITPAASAGEAQAAADVALTTTSGFFQASTDYVKLSVFETGGKPTRSQYCPDEEHPHNLFPDDVICRIQYKFHKLVNVKHPTHYAVVQVQQVIPQEAKEGEAPPIPRADESKPVVSVVLVRDLGNVRLLPAVYFVICFSLFIVFVVLLHYRDKTLQQNMDDAEAELAGSAGPKG